MINTTNLSLGGGRLLPKLINASHTLLLLCPAVRQPTLPIIVNYELQTKDVQIIR